MAGGEDGGVSITTTIDSLPAEVLEYIFGYLHEPSQLSRLAQVSRRWKSLAETDALWKELFRSRWMKDERGKRETKELESAEQDSTAANEGGAEETVVDWKHRFEHFYKGNKPPETCWKSFYLGHVRGPVARLLGELDRNPLSLVQLSKITFSSPSSATPVAPEVYFKHQVNQHAGSEVWIKELLNLSRSARLQEALSAYPRACRDHLEEMRESVLTRLNFLRRVRSMLFLGKLGLFAYFVKRVAPTLYPLPPNFLTARPKVSTLVRFWPLFAYSAAYYFVQRMLGRRGYMEGTPKWYLGVAKFCNHLLSSVLEEVGLRWLCINPFIVSVILANGLLKGGALALALVVVYGSAVRLMTHRHNVGSRLKYLNGIGVGMCLAYSVLRFDLMMHVLSWIVMPAFHVITRDAYREVIARGDNARIKYFYLFVVGLFVLNAAAHFASRFVTLRAALSSPSTAQLTLTIRNFFSAPPSLASLGSSSSTSSSDGLAPVAPWRSALSRFLDKRRAVLSQVLSLVNGNVVGWTLCHAAILHGFPTVVALKLLYEAEVLLLQLPTTSTSTRLW